MILPHLKPASMIFSFVILISVCVGCASNLAPMTTHDSAQVSNKIKLQIIAVNDFHGHIETTSRAFGGVGRADFLASNIKAKQAGVNHSIMVSAGDLIGASPLISSYFHDEPTIEAMNLIGLDINAVGNHEFDEGIDELLRMQNGGSHPLDGDLDGDSFTGAEFEFLAANVFVNSTQETIFPAYSVKNYEGIDVAFIGMTLQGTPDIVSPNGTAGLSFNDEVETVNALIPKLKTQGIKSIVVLLHEGGFSDGEANNCGTGLVGPIADIVKLLDDEVDIVIAGHTNDEFVCEIDGKWVTMADGSGRLFTDIDVVLDKTSKDMTVVAINNIPNLQENVIPDPTVTALIDKYAKILNVFSKSVIGTITEDITRQRNNAGESTLGKLITDAQLAATSTLENSNAQIAFTASGGIRNNLNFLAQGKELDGEVTFEEAFSVQPFGNNLVTMTLTGQQIHDLLERQFTDTGILQVSFGFNYSWSASAPDGDKVDASNIFLNGAVISPTEKYRVTVNTFIAEGGDNYKIFTQGTDRVLSKGVALDSLVSYFLNHSPIAPETQNRISKLP